MNQIKEYHVLSFGAGVQSTTMLFMSLLGHITPKPDFIVFSDTGWEPDSVYEHLKYCIEEAKKHNVEIEIINNGNIRDDLLNKNKRFASLPFFVKGTYEIIEEQIEQDDNQLNLFEYEFREKTVIGYEERRGMARRQCTNEYKIIPVNKAIRNFIGLKPRQRAKNIIVNKWMGISLDEIQRVKPSRDAYVKNRYPLIEEEMTRNDCLNWLEKNGFNKPPKSSCIGCPFHNDATWKDMKMNDKKSWDDAVLIDKHIRELPRFKGKAFLHRSCKPLEELNFDENQLDIDYFINECTGSCGL